MSLIVLLHCGGWQVKDQGHRNAELVFLVVIPLQMVQFSKVFLGCPSITLLRIS